MINKVITPSQKNVVLRALSNKAKLYSYIYVAICFFAFLLPILPFSSGWLKTANSSPEEAVALVKTDSGSGTAFLISEDYMMTARHVVEEAGVGSKVSVDFQQAQYSFETTAEVVSFIPSGKDIIKNLSSDVALLRLNTPVKNISPLELGNSDEFEKGNIIVLGYGLGDWSEPDGKITSNETQGIKDCYKVDVNANIGHSGSPVLIRDEKDNPTKVIGIFVADFNTVFTQMTGREINGEGVALKINTALQSLTNQGYLRDEILK